LAELSLNFLSKEESPFLVELGFCVEDIADVPGETINQIILIDRFVIDNQFEFVKYNFRIGWINGYSPIRPVDFIGLVQPTVSQLMTLLVTDGIMAAVLIAGFTLEMLMVTVDHPEIKW
jgi:hypothetical protein